MFFRQLKILKHKKSSPKGELLNFLILAFN
jgi:hypothetical protein